jgi:hypothetical protein
MYSTAGHVTVCVQEIMSWNWSGSNNAEVLSQAYTDADPFKKIAFFFLGKLGELYLLNKFNGIQVISGVFSNQTWLLKFRATRKKYGLFGLE